MKKQAILPSLFLLAFLGVGFSQQAEKPAKPPNLLLITVDTLRSDHLSSYGYHLKTSPRIDDLASESVRFHNVYTVIPQTGPAHISLFNSRYPQEHGARINGTAVPKNSKWLSLPQILKRFGYHNAAFVSAWTLNSRLTRLDRYFDSYDENLTRTYQLFNSSRYAEDVTPLALRWMDNNQKRPFFLWLHYFDPHSPYLLREKFASPEPSGHPAPEFPWDKAEIRERVKKYDSEIGYTDYHIGLVLDKLDQLGLRDDTVVVLTSDHGESLGEHGYVGHGRHLYENIVRVPLIIRYPGKTQAGKVVHERVSLLDVTPTILEMMLPPQTNQEQPYFFAGRSLAGALFADEVIPKRPMRYLAFVSRKGWAPKWLSWMWVQKAEMPLRMGVLEGPEKVLWTPGKTSVSIYDIKEDPYELNPTTLRAGNDKYDKQVRPLTRWFEATDLEESEVKLSERDAEILKTLGYIQ